MSLHPYFHQLPPVAPEQALTFDAPLAIARQPDFQFPNVALYATGVAPTVPVGHALADATPAPRPRQLDLPFPNIPALAARQLQVKPVGGVIDEVRPAPLAHQYDFQFPNLPIQTAAQLQVKPVGKVANDQTPASLAHQLDFQFPDVALIQTAQLSVPPVGETIDESIPRTADHQLDFQHPNLALAQAQPAAQPVTSPVFDRPVATALRPDAPLPNLLLTTLTVVAAPIFSTVPGDRPAPQQRAQDFTPPNVPLLQAAQLQVKPVGGVVDELAPAPVARAVDQPPRSVAQLASVVKPITNQFFDRPVATALPVDAPIPNLLLTTLFVAPGKPPVQNLYLLTDRPALRSPPWDPAQQNQTIHLPPPVAATLIQRTLVGVGL